MLVTPAPVCLLVVGFEFGELDGFVVFLRVVCAIRLIFTIVPFMIVIIFFIVVGPNGRVILGAKRCGHNCHWRQESGTQQGRVAEMRNGYFHRTVQWHLCGQTAETMVRAGFGCNNED